MKPDKSRNAVFITVTLILFAFIVLSIIFPSGQRKPKANGPGWQAVLEFIQSADKVETLATSVDMFPFTDPEADPHEYAKENSKIGPIFVQDISKEKRVALITYLMDRPLGPDPGTACFIPHHFVIAKKGPDRVVVSICYTCAAIQVSGPIQFSSGLNRGKLAEASKLFGGDVFTSLGVKDNE